MHTALPAPGAVAAMSDAPRAKRRATAAEKGKGPVVLGGAADAAHKPLSRDDVRALVARLDRGALEALLADAVADGVAPTADSLRAALPTRLRASVLAPTSIASSASLVDSGPFAALSADETLAIFGQLPLKDKLTVFSVCRGWYSLRLRPEAWPSLDVPAAKWICGNGALRLLQYAPAACGARAVSVDSSQRDSHRSVDTVRLLVNSLTSVEVLRLRDKVNVKCCEDIQKVHGQHLKALSIMQSVIDSKTALAVFKLAAGCPALRELWLSSDLLGLNVFADNQFDLGDIALTAGLSLDVLRVLSDSIAKTRNGGCSLLTSLRAVVSVKSLGRLGAVFPELESFQPRIIVNGAAGSPHLVREHPISAAQETESDAVLAAALPSHVAPLPRVTRFSATFMAEFVHNPSPKTVAAVLKRVLPALGTSLQHLALRSKVAAPSLLFCPLQLLAPGVAAGLRTLLLQGFYLGPGEDLGGSESDDEAEMDAGDGDGDGETGAAVVRSREEDRVVRAAMARERARRLLSAVTVPTSSEGQLHETDPFESLRDLRVLALDSCSGAAAQEACAAVKRCPSLLTLQLANIPLTAADVALLPPRQHARLKLQRCGDDAPAALVAGAKSGAFASLVTLVLNSIAFKPNMFPVAHELAQVGFFDPKAPFPSLLSLRLYGADLSAAEWGRLVAPKLRTIELVWGYTTQAFTRASLNRSAGDWEAVRAAVAAAVAAKCPLAAVVVVEATERSTYPLVSDTPDDDDFCI